MQRWRSNFTEFESFRLKNTCKFVKSNCQPGLSSPVTKRCLLVPSFHVSLMPPKMGTPLCPGWPDQPLCEEILPNILSKPVLSQLETVYSHPIICHPSKETNTLLAATSFQSVVESIEISLQTLLLLTEQTWFPQRPLVSLFSYSFHQLFVSS